MNLNRRWLEWRRRSKLRALTDDSGVSTIEYTMVLGFMSAIAIYTTVSIISTLNNWVAWLVVRMAIFLTGFPG